VHGGAADNANLIAGKTAAVHMSMEPAVGHFRGIRAKPRFGYKKVLPG